MGAPNPISHFCVATQQAEGEGQPANRLSTERKSRTMNVAGPVRARPVPLSDGKKRAYADGGGSYASSATGAAVDVDMYLDVPSYELSLDEFEEYALARLKVRRYLLQLIEASFAGIWGGVECENDVHILLLFYDT